MFVARDGITYLRRALRWIVCAILLSTVGCHVHHSALYNAPPELPIATQPNDKSHVHVYLIHGLDPFDWANLKSIVCYCNNLGFEHVRLVQFHEADKVIHDAAAARAVDPQARILIFGYSAGAASTRRAVKTLHDKYCIDVDVIMYLSGITLFDTEYSRPEYVGKIIHILDRGMIIRGMQLTGAENYRLHDVWHFGSPTHPQTLIMLRDELQRLALLSSNLAHPQ